MAACLFINISDDGGQTWTSQPKGCGEPPVDHQTLTTGNPWPAVAPWRTPRPPGSGVLTAREQEDTG